MKTNGTPRDDSAASGPNGTLGPDAEWSALRYVLGEMTAAEADAFEQTLASDPQACEQVAAATRLTNTVLAAELSGQAPNGVGMPQSARPTPVVVPARSVRGPQVRSGQWAIVGLAAAVCIVVAGGLSWLSSPNTPQDATALDRADGAGSLVAMWT